jgi:hypothetical protein
LKYKVPAPKAGALYLMGLGELTDPLPLPDDDHGHDDRQDRPDDHKDPYVNFLVGNAKDIRPVDQDSHTPIENLIHHSTSVFEMKTFYDVPTFKGLHGLSDLDSGGDRTYVILA